LITPGKNRIGTTLRLRAEFKDDAGTYVDPVTVTASLCTPSGTITETAYPTAPTGRTSTGLYYVDYIPEEGGRHFVRWLATFSGSQIAIEDNFTVQTSPFIDVSARRY
jgi:hypothetical protein